MRFFNRIAFVSVFIAAVYCGGEPAPSTVKNGVTRIVVDGSKPVAHGVNRKLGICLNFTIDRNEPSLRKALDQLGVAAIRFQEGEFGDNWHFDHKNPAQPLLGVADRKVWYHRSKSDGRRWKSTLSPDDFLELAASQKLEAYSIAGIDALIYNGSAPHLSRAEVLTSAGRFVAFAREIAERLQRTGPIIRYWEIGNENDLAGMLGKLKLGDSWTAAEYAQMAAEMAVRIKEADPRVHIGVNGMTPKSNWWRDVLTTEVTVEGRSGQLSEMVDFLVTHQYSWARSYADWYKAGPDWKYAANVKAAVDAAKQLAPGKPVAVTEWSAYSPGTQRGGDSRNNAWHAVHNLQMLGEILKHDEVMHACFWVTRWSSDAGSLHNALAADGRLTPVGESLRFWSEFAEPELLQGSHAGKICVYATCSKDNDRMAIFLLNRSDRGQLVDLVVNGTGTLRVVRIEHLCAAGDNPVAGSVERRKGTVKSQSGNFRLNLPPISATLVLATTGKNPVVRQLK